MKVLVIGIHMDDCEAMSGTAALLVRNGADVTFLNIKHYMHYKGGIQRLSSPLIPRKRLQMERNENVLRRL